MVDIPTEAVAEVRGLDELRLLIFPQPLGGALKNQNAAPASPPCFRRRRRSAPLLFSSCTVHHKKIPRPNGLGIWWSILHSTRTFMQASRCCVRYASSQETAGHQRVSTPAHEPFELILMQGNSFYEEPVFFGSVRIIHMEAFTNNVKPVKQFNRIA